MTKTRFGIIGVGGWGEFHVRVLQDHPFAQVTAVCDANIGRARSVAEKYGIPFATEDFHQLLKQDDVDSVSIITPDFAHLEPTLAALESGKNVLVEKPMATTLEDCIRISDLASRSKGKFMVDFHNRWSPPFYKAKDAIDKGELGKVQMISYRLNDTIFVPTKMLSWSGKSTVMWFIGSHSLDTLFWLFGKPLQRVYSVARSEVLASKGITTPDYYCCILEFEGGGTAMLENGWILSESTPNIIDLKCSILGSEGTIYIDGSHHRMLQKYTATEATYPDVFVLPTVYGKPGGFAAESIRHFADCIVENKQPMVGAKEGLAVTKAILAIEESVRSGHPVTLSK
ncbi:MAG TPA: Gfo/Idh/MocA family oxidoreductase [bacterium]|nr:Gfo/Idh/MocA family oxidoreductase [bacterium]